MTKQQGTLFTKKTKNIIIPWYFLASEIMKSSGACLRVKWITNLRRTQEERFDSDVGVVNLQVVIAESSSDADGGQNTSLSDTNTQFIYANMSQLSNTFYFNNVTYFLVKLNIQLDGERVSMNMVDK